MHIQIKPKKILSLAIALVFIIMGLLLISNNIAFAQDYIWRQVNISGFGDANNTTSSSITSFNGNIFIGTTFSGAGGGEVWRSSNGTSWSAASTNGFGDANNTAIVSIESHGGFLYAGTLNTSTGTEIWRCSRTSGCNQNGDWNQVNTDGFGTANNDMSLAMESYNRALYVSTRNNINRAQIWRSVNGTAWTQVNTSGFGVAGLTRIDTLETFDNDLYAGTGIFSTEIWRCTLSSGCNAAGDWVQMMSGGFGDAQNRQIEKLITFGTNIYAGTFRTANGGEIWRSSNGVAWNEVVGGAAGGGNGFGDPNNDSMITAEVARGYLYFGTMNSATGGEIWRTANGTSWTQVNDDGFGSGNNDITSAMVEFGNHLFAGTHNLAAGTQVWQMNYEPEISGVGAVQRTDGSGKVAIDFSADDIEGDDLRARVEYNTGSGWQKATLSTVVSETNAAYGDPGINNGAYYQVGTILSSSGVNDVSVTWNSKTDVPMADISNARVRVVLFDGISEGNWETSAPFELDNVPPNPPTLNPISSPTRITPQLISGGKDADSSVLLNARIIVALNASDAWSYNLDLFEGINGLSLTSRDRMGNESVSIDARIILDTIPPTTEASPLGGTYTGEISVSLFSNEPGIIYYTTDGSDPTTSSSVYSGPILITEDTNVKFFAVDLVGNQEGINEENYIIAPARITLNKTVNTGGTAAAVSSTNYKIDDILFPSPLESLNNLKAIYSSVINFFYHPSQGIYEKAGAVFLVIMLGLASLVLVVLTRGKYEKFKDIFSASSFVNMLQLACIRNKKIIIFSVIGIALMSALELFLAFNASTAADTYVDRGDVLTYRIEYRNVSADDVVELYIADPVPYYTDYIGSSMIINGASVSDEADTDGADFNVTWADQTVFRIGTVPAGGSGYVEFKARVRYSAPDGALIPDRAYGAYNPGDVAIQSNAVLNIVRSISPVPPYIPSVEEEIEEVEGEIEEEIKEIEEEEEVVEEIIEEIIEEERAGATLVERVIPKAVMDNIYENETLQAINKWGIAPLLVLAVIANILSAMSLFGTVFPFLRYLWQVFTEPAMYFGKGKRQGWGTVYDSQTKQPLSLAIVRLFDDSTKKLVETKVTDFEGRYLIIVDPDKKYYLEVTKAGYVFPSKILSKAKSDSDFDNIYHGEVIVASKNKNIDKEDRGYIAYSIPLDLKEGVVFNAEAPLNPIDTSVKDVSDLNRMPEKVVNSENKKILRRETMFKANRVIGYLGPIFGFISFIITPSWFTFILLVIHLLLLAMFIKLSKRKEIAPFGRVFDLKNQKPLGRSVVRLFERSYGKLLSVMVSKNDGRYGFLIGNEKYFLNSTKDGYVFPKEKIEILGEREKIARKDLGMEKIRD